MTAHELKVGLQKLSGKDKHLNAFGATAHNYELNRCLAETDICQFEECYSIILPTDYRNFLKMVGNGGAGPGYGLFSLEDWNFELDITDRNFLNKPFPHSQEWNLPWADNITDANYDEEIVKRELEYFKEKYITGSLRISHYGCAIYYLLVVSGQEAGNVWVDDRANDEGIFPAPSNNNKQRLTFSDWYGEWLNESIAGLSK